MTNELEEKLLTAAPILYQQYNKLPNETCMCWGFECPDTWFDLLFDLSQKLEAFNNGFKEYNCSIQAAQVKEKYGELCFYYDVKLNEKLDKITLEIIKSRIKLLDKFILETERKSSKICAFCGKPATHCTDGWVTYLCDDCDVKKRPV